MRNGPRFTPPARFHWARFDKAIGARFGLRFGLRFDSRFAALRAPARGTARARGTIGAPRVESAS
ncbi:hypothetical protein AWB71_00638 [Caballeronia peredens]|nr:hypothetical protein AWB71_00638 [Caballeronia peredens]